jgi:hypothetical protein
LRVEVAQARALLHNPVFGRLTEFGAQLTTKAIELSHRPAP